MSGERPFDDDRWPDEEGFACCFMCGKKVDPRDPGRGTFTMNAAACELIPAHLSCLEGYGGDQQKTDQVQIAYMTALNQMGQEQVRRSRRLAQCATVPITDG